MDFPTPLVQINVLCSLVGPGHPIFMQFYTVWLSILKYWAKNATLSGWDNRNDMRNVTLPLRTQNSNTGWAGLPTVGKMVNFHCYKVQSLSLI